MNQPPSSLNFRLATFSDLEPLIALTNECFGENTDLASAQKIFKANQSDKNQLYLLGEIDGEIVAHARIAIVPTIYEDMNTFAILNHVCVKPEFRREHIGTKLLDECFRLAKDRGVKTVELWSKNFRVAAHRLYLSYGFEVMDAKFFTKDIQAKGVNHEN